VGWLSSRTRFSPMRSSARTTPLNVISPRSGWVTRRGGLSGDSQARVPWDDGVVPHTEERPLDATPRRTDELPATPSRDRTIPVDAWLDAPPELRALGDDIGQPLVAYIRRIGDWLLWRAGPPTHADTR